MIKNKYISKKHGCIGIKVLNNGDLINPIEYKQAIEFLNAETIIAYDENNNVIGIKTKSLILALNYYSHFELVKCCIEKSMVKIYPIINDN